MPNTLNRIVIAGNIYHQNAGENPTSIELACTRSLSDEGNEQPWNRTPGKGVGEDWEQLNLGWIEGNPSLLLLRNLDDTAYGSEDWEGKHIEIRYSGETPFVVPPGMPTVLYPQKPLEIRCRVGEARYTIIALPE